MTNSFLRFMVVERQAAYRGQATRERAARAARPPARRRNLMARLRISGRRDPRIERPSRQEPALPRLRGCLDS